MENQTPTTSVEWTSTKVYTLGVIPLALGVALGALFHGPAQPSHCPSGHRRIRSADGTWRGADASAASATRNAMRRCHRRGKGPGFWRSRSNIANNFDLLSQAGNAEMRANDPKRAAESYYIHALNVKADLDVRTNLANAYFRAGDADQSRQSWRRY